MNDPFAVRVVECAEHVGGDAQRLVERQRARLLQPRLERFSFHVLGGQKGDDVVLVTGLEQRDHVGVMQRGAQFRLALKAAVELLAIGVVVEALLGPDDLQRDSPADPAVPRQIDLSDRSFAEKPLDFVLAVRDRLVLGLGHVKKGISPESCVIAAASGTAPHCCTECRASAPR